MVDKIKKYFDKNDLSLTEKGQIILRSNEKAVKELKALVPEYEKETRLPIYICCQNTINDFIIILQKYYKDNGNTKVDNKKRTKSDIRPK